MMPEELQTSLTEIEKAELFTACQNVLTEAGMNLLRRLMFDRTDPSPDDAACFKTHGLNKRGERQVGQESKEWA